MNEDEIKKRRLRQRVVILRGNDACKIEEDKGSNADQRNNENIHLSWELFRQSWLDVITL